MSRDLEININVVDNNAKQKLREIDQAFDQTTAKATTTAAAINATSVALEAGSVQAVAYRKQVLDAASGMNTFTVSAIEADRYLSNLYVSMQKLPSTFTQLRTGLNDIASGAGLTVTGLGAINAAGLVIGTGYTAWKIGSIINDLTGLDTLLAKNSWQGWALQAQEAAAKTDTLARASAIAGYEIRDMTKAVEELTRAQKVQLDQAARTSAPGTNQEDVFAIYRQVNELKASGAWANIAKDIEAGLVPLNTLIERYRILPGVITVMREQQKAHTDEIKRSIDSANHYAAYVDEWTNKLKQQADKEDRAREKAQAEEKKILGEIRVIESERLSDAQALLRVTSNMRAELEASQKAMKELAAGASAELDARSKNLARSGLGMDSQGRVQTQGTLNDPGFQRDEKLRQLDREPDTAAGKSERQTAIVNEWLDAVQKNLEVTVGMTAAERQAADAASRLSGSHMGAVRAADGMSSAFDHFTGVLMTGLDASPQERDVRNAPLITPDVGIFTGGSVGQFSGSGVGIGGFPLITASGRAAGVTNGTSSGGFSMGDVIVNGNVDNEATARRLAEQVAQKIMDRMGTQVKPQLTKR